MSPTTWTRTTVGSSVTRQDLLGEDLDLTGDAVIDRYLQVKGPRPWVDVTHPDFGAVGDGSFDCAAAIAAAIASLPSMGGIVLFPPPAVHYNVASSIAVDGKRNILFQGAGRWGDQAEGGTIIRGSMAGPIFEIKGTTQAAYNIGFRDLVVVNIGAGYALRVVTSDVARVIAFVHAWNSEFTNKGTGDAVSIEGAIEIGFYESLIRATNGGASAALRTATGAGVIPTTLDFFGTTIKGKDQSSTGGVGLSLGSLLGCRLFGGTLEDVGTCILTGNVDNLTVIGNHFETNYRGINVDVLPSLSTSRDLISGNYMGGGGTFLVESVSRPNLTHFANGGTPARFGDTEAVKFASGYAAPALSPAQITSDQNNYNPGLEGSWRLSSDAARTITGIAGGTNGRRLTIVNIGSFNILLANQHASSSDPNKIITGTAATITLLPDDVAMLEYDSVTSRWRVTNTH